MKINKNDFRQIKQGCKRNLYKLAAVIMAVSALGFTACKSTAKTEEKNTGFEPALDTQTSCTVEISGFMGNFESLDYVINGFNEIYPNVTFAYDHNTSFMLSDYLNNNKNVDIFMISGQNIAASAQENSYVADRCLNLSSEGIDVSALNADAVNAYTVDGKLLGVPIMMNSYGIVVNKTLLKNEGLSMPADYNEFISVLDSLKKKGYTPLQGSQEHLYGELMVNMAMNILAEDRTLVTALGNGEDRAVTAMLPVFERLGTIINRGYTDYELNSTFPKDNYDGTIKAFFNGDMPFYVCNTECVSGMKKRESKSETYSAAPFEYEFLYAPLGDSGVYAYMQPWYAFAVSKDSDVKDMAAEFLRYMSQPEVLNTMAEIKRLPSVVSDNDDELYQGILNAGNVQSGFSNDGSVSVEIRDTFIQVCNDFGAGRYNNAEEAARDFVSQCKK